MTCNFCSSRTLNTNKKIQTEKKKNREADLVKYYKFFVSTQNKNKIIIRETGLFPAQSYYLILLMVNHDCVLRFAFLCVGGFPTYTLSEYMRTKSTWIKCIYMQLNIRTHNLKETAICRRPFLLLLLLHMMVAFRKVWITKNHKPTYSSSCEWYEAQSNVIYLWLTTLI